MQCTATVDATRKNTTGIRVPGEVVDVPGQGKRPPATISLNGYTYRTTVASMGDEYMLSVSAEVREKAGVQAGDTVDVEIALDTAPREVEVPEDLADALAEEPVARKFFDGLSYSNKRRIVTSIECAKTAETHERRIWKAIESLKEE